jgi:imidazolonepropionase-like amidohydrolase
MKYALSLLILLLAAPLSAQVIAIRAGTVIDPAHGTGAKDQVILVENGKVKSIGAGLPIPADAQLIDLSHEWVTPGLIDAHTHMTLTEIDNAPFESYYLNQSSTLRGLHGLHNVMQALQAGFTAVRDVGNSAAWAMSVARSRCPAGRYIARHDGRRRRVVTDQQSPREHRCGIECRRGRNARESSR